MRILLTGANSFLGRHLLQRLLLDGHDIALLLPWTRRDIYTELQVLLEAWYAPDQVLELLQSRLQLFEGSIKQEGLGLLDAEYERLCRWTEGVVHCAAGLSFQERYTQGLRLENILGTEQVLAFVSRSNCRHFHYVSTAYVCGRQQGVVREEAPTDRYGFRNRYEQFKFYAERLVNDFSRKHTIPISVYRPGIILENPGSMGLLQAVCLQTDWLVNLRKYLPGTCTIERVRQGIRFTVAGDPEATLNLVPVDYCARALARIVSQPDRAGYRVYHLINPAPPSMRTLTRSVSEVLGIKAEVVPALGPEVAWTTDIEHGLLRKLERLIYRSYRVYLPYHYDRLAFDDTNTRAALHGSGIRCPLIDQPFLVQFLQARLAKRAQQFLSLLDLVNPILPEGGRG